MGWARDIGVVEVDEVSGMVKAATVGLPEEERSTLAAAIETAKAGVRAMGGKAHVWLGGHDRDAFYDEAAGGPQPSQTSITVTVSLVGNR